MLGFDGCVCIGSEGLCVRVVSDGRVFMVGLRIMCPCWH